MFRSLMSFVRHIVYYFYYSDIIRMIKLMIFNSNFIKSLWSCKTVSSFLTNSTSVPYFESHEAVLSPSLSPTVLQFPISGGYSNQIDVMSYISAITPIEYSCFVWLHRSRIDSYRHWTCVNSVLYLFASISLISNHSNLILTTWRSSTYPLHSLPRVFWLSSKSFLLYIV